MGLCGSANGNRTRIHHEPIEGILALQRDEPLETLHAEVRGDHLLARQVRKDFASNRYPMITTRGRNTTANPNSDYPGSHSSTDRTRSKRNEPSMYRAAPTESASLNGP